MTEASEKKDVQKLQRVIVDSLEDIKAQDIQAFNTEHLSALFERVIIACGTSNRQTKALAASVRDEVRDAGFGKPRMEGEENGEWIIVDCGSVVVHIMQPSIRQYYHLEEIWGDKPVRLKLGAPKPAEPVRKPVAKKKANVSAGRTPTRRDSVPVGPMGSEALKPTRKAPAKSAGKPAAKAAGKTAGTTTGKTASKTASKAPKSSAKMVTKTAAKPAVKSSAKAKPKA